MKQETGNLGEKLAAKFLSANGFKIVETNYWRKWGEIDIIAEKDNILHFVEVKATGSDEESGYRPEENI
ncbi:MAG: YraN family protein, partial [Patescibacteria group bacterium]